MTSLLMFTLALLPGADARPEVPRVLAPQFAGVGRLVPDLRAADLNGKEIPLTSRDAATRATVIALTSTSCPVSKKYLPELARLEKQYLPRGVRFLFINPIASDTAEDARKAVEALGITGAYLRDADGKLAAALGAQTTAAVLLLDSRNTIVYHGAVDDRYGVGYSREKATQRYLTRALDALLDDQPISVPATTAPGCELSLGTKPAQSPTSVTYHNRISRIVQRNCLECHRDGGIGPFALETAEQIVAHKGMIRRVLTDGTMPPWFAAATTGHSPWANDRSLPPADKSDFLAWLAAGSPIGNPADAPLPVTFPEDWAIGKPDLIVAIPRLFEIQAEGTMPYQNVTVELNLDEDRWVDAVEIRPTAKEVVHHVVVFALSPGDNLNPLDRARQAAEERRGFFAAYVPGNASQIYPEGFAKKLPKGTRLRFQIHYTPNGTATSDQTMLAIRFADKPPKHELKVTGIANPKIEIPPGNPNHPETGRLRVPFDARITAMMPHLHLRGKSCRYELTTPDGKKTTLLEIPRYDFNWQLKYQLAEPVLVPRGSILTFTANFDNSPDNPANPDPKATVRWGPQTYDEMLLGYIEFYLPSKP